jgi:hypothetical protein
VAKSADLTADFDPRPPVPASRAAGASARRLPGSRPMRPCRRRASIRRLSRNRSQRRRLRGRWGVITVGASLLGRHPWDVILEASLLGA